MRPSPALRQALVAATFVLAACGGPASAQDPSSPAAAAPFDPRAVRLSLAPHADGLDSPVFVAGDGSGSGRLLVVERPGRIRAVAPDGRLEDQPVLDIRDRVVAGGEQGLLGLALHPDHAANQRLFVNYTRRADGATTISEFILGDGGTVDPAGERVMLVIPQPYGNHNGGMIAFDRDGMLIIGMGDGGAGGDPEGNGQRRDSLLGKMLRIDVDGAQPYAIPADNPFVGDPVAAPEIWALGVRNPWRFSVDRATGDLWIGDVGQGAWEEVDVLPAGAGGLNLGWNVMEGDACYAEDACDPAGLHPPAATLSHGDGACSVIGGHVYRGTEQPLLTGGYLYTDLCTGELWVLDAAGALALGAATPVLAGRADGDIVSFGEGDDGEPFAVDLGGAILRVVAEPVSAG